jgi:hypothetical protein
MAHVKKIPEWNRGNPLFKKADHIPATEKPISTNAKIAAKENDPRIDILILKRPNDTYYAKIKFYSHVKPNWLLEGVIELTKGKSEREMDFEVGITCGAMAERLDELYGDRFDPEKSAREGSQKFGELLREWKRQTEKRG